MLKDLVEFLLLPPGGLIALGLLGLALWRRRLGRWLTGLALALFLLLSVPATAYWLIGPLQAYPALGEQSLSQAGAQAIVVLGGGRKIDTPEYGTTLTEWGILRLRYAAYLQRQTGLPVVTSGGAVRGGGPPEAEIMQRILSVEYGGHSPWAESQSRNTFENAKLTQELLAQHGIRRIFLVTHALHMARAVKAFEHAGFEVIPAPTDFVGQPGGLRAVLPRARTFYQSALAVHELVGRIWYRIRYY